MNRHDAKQRYVNGLCCGLLIVLVRTLQLQHVQGYRAHRVFPIPTSARRNVLTVQPSCIWGSERWYREELRSEKLVVGTQLTFITACKSAKHHEVSQVDIIGASDANHASPGSRTIFVCLLAKQQNYTNYVRFRAESQKRCHVEEERWWRHKLVLCSGAALVITLQRPGRNRLPNKWCGD